MPATEVVSILGVREPLVDPGLGVVLESLAIIEMAAPIFLTERLKHSRIR